MNLTFILKKDAVQEIDLKTQVPCEHKEQQKNKGEERESIKLRKFMIHGNSIYTSIFPNLKHVLPWYFFANFKSTPEINNLITFSLS